MSLVLSGWLTDGRLEFPALFTNRIPLFTPPGELTYRFLRWHEIDEKRGQVGACTPLQFGLTSRARAHGKSKLWFSALLPHKKVAKIESAVCELVMNVLSRVYIATPLLLVAQNRPA